MEKDINMELNGEMTPQQKSKLPLIGIIAAVVLIAVVVFFAAYNSPKALAGRLIKNTDDAVVDFFTTDGEQPLFLTESHQSETKLSMNAEDLGLDGDIELEFKTGYQNDTGDLMLEMVFGLADLDAIDLGLYLKESELGLVSSLLTNKYVLDFESEAELGKNTTLEERIELLFVSEENTAKMEDLQARAEAKAEEYRKFAVKELPKDAVSKAKEEIELFGEDVKVPYVEIALDEDQFQEWMEVILEKAAEDEELQDLADEYVDLMNEMYSMEDLDMDMEEIDIEDECEDALDELKDSEVEFEIKIYHQGSTPIAYGFSFDDGYSKGEGIVQLVTYKENKQILVDVEGEYDEAYFNIIMADEIPVFMEYEIEGMKYEYTVEEVEKGVYEIEGKIESEYGMSGDIKGEIVESRNETTYEIEYDLSDGYSETEMVVEGKVVTEGSVVTTTQTVEAKIDGELFCEVDMELAREEVRKNKEYTVEGELKINVPMEGLELKIDIENQTIYGSEAEVDVPSWSKDDVYAQLSDIEELEELVDTLAEDFEMGFAEIFAAFMYGDMY